MDEPNTNEIDFPEMEPGTDDIEIPGELLDPEEVSEDDEPTQDDQAEADEEPKEGQPGTVEIDGKQYTAEELRELVSKGSDYTKKTQQLSEERKSLQQKIELAEALETAFADKSEFASYLATLNKNFEEMHGEPAPQTLRLDDLSEEGASLARHYEGEIKRINAAHAAQTQRLEARVAELTDIVKPIVEERQKAAALDEAVVIVKKQYGIEATKDDIAAAMKATGRENPVDAFAVHNLAKIKDGSYEAGRAAALRKPVTPKGGAREASRGTSPSDFFLQQISGEIPAD